MIIRTPRDAEEAARQWMASHGFADASLTSRGADGGVDIRAEGAVAQVKAEIRPTGRPAIQQLCGVAWTERLEPLFFSLGGYTAEAIEWSDAAEVALFVFDLSGEVAPFNQHAESVAQFERPAPLWPQTRAFLEQMASSEEEELTLRARQPFVPGSWSAQRTSWAVSVYSFVALADGEDPDWHLTILPSHKLESACTDLVLSALHQPEKIANPHLREMMATISRNSEPLMWSCAPGGPDEILELLQEVIPREQLTEDDFEFSLRTPEEERIESIAEALEFDGPPTHFGSAKELTRQLVDLYRRGHTYEVNGRVTEGDEYKVEPRARLTIEHTFLRNGRSFGHLEIDLRPEDAGPTPPGFTDAGTITVFRSRKLGSPRGLHRAIERLLASTPFIFDDFAWRFLDLGRPDE